MILEKLGRYIYEIDYNNRKNIDTFSFDEIVEMLVSVNEKERQEILESLTGEIKEKIDAMIEGGLI